MFRSKPVVTVLRLYGAIGAGGRFSRSLDDASLAPLVKRAFAPKRLKAVALSVNSPGGSPAQSALIASRIRDLAAEKNVPVLAFVEDVAASGGYWLACAADEIYAVETSVVGSIGVISASFGLDEAIKRLGVERRVQTAGDSKLRLDPFQPLKDEDRAWLAELQEKIHRRFIATVKERRGGKLDGAPEQVFSGEVYLGEEAVELGLIDGIGRLGPVVKQRFGDKVKLEVVAPKRGFLSRFGGGSSVEGSAGAIGAGLVDRAVDVLEERVLWARFGL